MADGRVKLKDFIKVIEKSNAAHMHAHKTERQSHTQTTEWRKNKHEEETRLKQIHKFSRKGRIKQKSTLMRKLRAGAQELKACLASVMDMYEIKTVKELFGRIDVDNSDSIDMDELRAVLNAFNHENGLPKLERSRFWLLWRSICSADREAVSLQMLIAFMEKQQFEWFASSLSDALISTLVKEGLLVDRHVNHIVQALSTGSQPRKLKPISRTVPFPATSSVAITPSSAVHVPLLEEHHGRRRVSLYMHIARHRELEESGKAPGGTTKTERRRRMFPRLTPYQKKHKQAAADKQRRKARTATAPAHISRTRT